MPVALALPKGGSYGSTEGTPMIIDRKIASAPRTEALAHNVAGLNGPCIGCEGCRGVCAAMIDAMLVPDIILAASAHHNSAT